MIKLTKAQARGMGRAIRWHFEQVNASPFSTKYFTTEERKLLMETSNRLENGGWGIIDLDIATYFRFLPYTHSYVDTELAPQLLAWHKLGALDLNFRLSDAVEEIKSILKYSVLEEEG